LAEKELREAELLSTFLPPLLQGNDLERALTDAIHSLPDQDQKVIGKVLKRFYSTIDKTSVDPQSVKTCLDALLEKA
jgi:uncharacterized protein YqeY